MKTEDQKEKELNRIKIIYNFLRNFPDRKSLEISSSLYELDLSESTWKRTLAKMCNSPIPYLFKVDNNGKIVNNGKGKYRINPFGSPNKDDNAKIFMEIRERGPFNLKNNWKRLLELLERHNNVTLSLEAISGIFPYLCEIGNESYFMKKKDFNYFLEGYSLLYCIFNEDIKNESMNGLEYDFEGQNLNFSNFLNEHLSRYPDELKYLNI